MARTAHKNTYNNWIAAQREKLVARIIEIRPMFDAAKVEALLFANGNVYGEELLRQIKEMDSVAARLLS